MHRLPTFGIVFCIVSALATGCSNTQKQSRHDIPAGPPINMYRIMHDAEPGSTRTERSGGTVEFELTREKPETTFWNDPDTKADPWGTIALQQVRNDGSVVIRFGGEVLHASPGKTFPGTGIMVVKSDSSAQSAEFRSRLTMTIVHQH